MKAVEDESKLVKDACQGSVSAFESLVILYEPRIRRMLYSMTQDVQLTQDLCQETFLSAFRALPRMNGEELHFAAWLYRIALNHVRSEWRKRKHVTWISLSSPQNGDETTDDINEENLISDEHFEESVLERDIVQHVLAQLPPSSAMCLLLDAEGFTYNEIAETMQDSLSAVRSRLSRARHAFQRIYKSLDQEMHS